ncbi:hypothetical protein [Paracoccus sp. (in: a-proteobacteria)]|uniref:hypothetical protein n=1 Tax=Paracoccus sp. TaxID=267 RepID=UPI0028B1C0A3|nr:hypothetical protein [Paracoccus sp. (in: a-proteobacteria)]
MRIGPTDSNLDALNRHLANGEEEGARCDRAGCGGTMIVPDVEGCTCFISPPCSACVNNPLTCDECGAKVE